MGFLICYKTAGGDRACDRVRVYDCGDRHALCGTALTGDQLKAIYNESLYNRLFCITTNTVNQLCSILGCGVSDIMMYIED